MFDHYIGLDWAQSNMAIARMTAKSNKVHVIDVKADIGELIVYLKRLKGKKIITLEETTTSQWLYTELREYVDKIVVCDPYRNKILNEGAKTDKIDATKLVKLLRADMLKPVYHSGDQFIYLRKLVSGYEDTVKAYVRAVNQRAAVYRSCGIDKNREEITGQSERFVVEGLDRQIELIKEERKRYEQEFSKLCSKFKLLKNLKSSPGIQDISAVKIAARIVDINRFASAKHLWSYCGLIKYEKISGGKSYGKRKPRCSRSMKQLICTSVNNAVREHCNNPLKMRYDYLRQEKKYSEHQAKVAVRRLLSSIIFGVMKSNKKFDAERVRTVKQN